MKLSDYQADLRTDKDLHLNEGAEMNVQPDQKQGIITITPVPSLPAARGVDEHFARQVSDFIDQYRPALQALAGT